MGSEVPQPGPRWPDMGVKQRSTARDTLPYVSAMLTWDGLSSSRSWKKPQKGHARADRKDEKNAALVREGEVSWATSRVEGM